MGKHLRPRRLALVFIAIFSPEKNLRGRDRPDSLRGTRPTPMPFTELETARIEAAMSDFMAKRRPPVEIHPGGDRVRIVGYR